MSKHTTKTVTHGEVSSFNVRWTNDDIEAGLPERYEKALETCGGSFSGTTRALIRLFTEEIEEHGCPAIKSAVSGVLNAGTSAKIVLNEPSPKYGAKGGKKTKG